MEKYNTEQKQAIAHGRGPALVVAGAGTGKTAVITQRILQLITAKKVASEKILALTFTDKAAAQMQDRVDEVSPIGYVDSTITTFHSFCAEVLRSYGVEIGLSADFTIISTYQQVVILQAVINDLNLKYYKTASNPYSFVSAVLRFFSHLKDEGITEQKFAEFVDQSGLDGEEKERNQELARLFSAFEKAKLEQNCLDYADLLVYCLHLFQSRKEVLKYFQQQYQYILVDEYQDTNYVQNEIVKMLSKKHQNLFVVGDDDQSIYRFRGAAISNILHFMNDFPDATQFVLTQNYRSTQEILDASYRLVSYNNPYRLESQNSINKKLTSSKTGKAPEVMFFATQPVEAQWVTGEIEKLIEGGTDPREIAILLRKNNQAESFTHLLEKKSIPYELSQNKRLFEQEPVRSLINLVKAINNPADSQALYLVLVGEIYRLPINDVVAASAAAHRSRVSLEEYLSSATDVSVDIKRALDDITSMRQSATALTGGQILYSYLENHHTIQDLVTKSESDYNAVLQLQYLSQFFSLIRDYERTIATPNLFGLYLYFELMHQSEVDIVSEVAPLDQSAVQILTVHKAKGLEFKVVFLVDMVEQTFPATRRSEPIRIPEGLLESTDAADINWHLLEERRLCYVAMTRAKELLYITGSADHGGKRAKKPSRFISEATNFVPTKLEHQDGKTVFNDFEPPQAVRAMKNFDPTHRYFDTKGWLHLSANQVADYLRSPKEFWYFDVLQLPKGPFHSLVYGSAMHAAIEYYYSRVMRSQKVTLEELYTVFDNCWKSEGFVSFQHEQSRRKRGKEILSGFYKQEQAKKDFPKWVEKPFTLRLAEVGMVIRGRYDAVFDRGGQIEISDFKTGEVKDEKAAQKKLKESIQMAIYALAWEKIHNSPVDSLSLNFLEKSLLVKQPPVDKNVVLAKLEKVRDGILNKEFSQSGESRIKFGSFIE